MNSPSFSVVIMEYNVTLGLRSLILTETTMYLSMNDYNDSSLAWRRLTKATNVVWWGQLVAYCALKSWAKVMNESIDHGCKRLHHINASPLREVGKTLHNTIFSFEYKFIWVVNASRCSSESDVSSYLLIFNDFQVMGKGMFMMPSTNECKWMTSLWILRDLGLEWIGVSSRLL